MLTERVSPPVSTGTPLSLASASRTRGRVALVVSADSSLRTRLRQSLTGLRWQVIEAPGGAEAWMASQSAPHIEALLIDPWLPDLDVSEFLKDFRHDHPLVDMTLTDGTSALDSPRSPYHQELLYALRRSQDGDTAAWQAAPPMGEGAASARLQDLPRISPPQKQSVHLSAAPISHEQKSLRSASRNVAAEAEDGTSAGDPAARAMAIPLHRRELSAIERIPELVGTSPAMLEVSRRIRLVASRSTPVLIEGPTGSGKELVAEALHRLSSRYRKSFVAINCAAIPEALLEAELFGHTRGAFTGAVQGRIGRIESADGGTLFLDEIGEMPLALQSKLLRFVESGELQRIGDNETVKVDVRILAATHQPLAEDAQKDLFRADLYYRLAVFLIRTPSLAEHMEDLPALVAHFLERMGRKAPVKRIDSSAMNQLVRHHWPGNVRELEHVLERAEILCGDEPVITVAEIDLGFSNMN
jgi:DNA-binding NtrC family response regulator